MKSVVQFATVLLLFVFVLFITWATTRWIAKIQKVQSVSKGRNLELIEGINLGNGKYAQILRTGSKYIVVGIGKDEVSLLAELNADELNLEESPGNEALTFSAVFERAKSLGKKEDKNS